MIIRAASPAGHEWENGDVITPEALEKAVKVGFTNLPLVHDPGREPIGKVTKVEKLENGYVYHLDLNETGKKFMADIGKGPTPSISGEPK